VLSRAAVEAGDVQRTRLVAAQGLKLAPDAACLHVALAKAAQAEKATAAALLEYEKAASLDPKLIEAQFAIAEIAFGYKNLRRAISAYEKVLELEPNHVAALVNLGVVLKAAARFEDAEKAYRRAIEAAGNEPAPDAHFNLGVLYLRHLGKNEEAKAELKRYLQVSSAGSDDPAFAMLEEIEQRRAMEEESKRMEEEAKRQAEVEKKAAEEEARRKAEEERQEAELKKRMEAAEQRARDSGEPADPDAGKPK
jgi:tetratricopeptide (TPR) repeat protein